MIALIFRLAVTFAPVLRDTAFLLPLGITLAFGGDLRGIQKAREKEHTP